MKLSYKVCQVLLHAQSNVVYITVTDCACIYLCIGKLEEDLEAAKRKIREKMEVLVRNQKEMITEKVLQSLDKDTRAELADNAWLHKQVHRRCHGNTNEYDNEYGNEFWIIECPFWAV